jgi:hypothetical protein
VPEVPYRASLGPPPDPYLVAWVDLRRRRAWSLVILTAYLVVSSAVLANRLPLPWGAFLRIGAGGVGGLLGFVFPHSRFRCPHCGKKFQGWRWKVCRACGIPIGTPKSAVLDGEKGRSAALPIQQGAGAPGLRIGDADAGAMHAETDAEVDAASALTSDVPGTETT